ncbi:hypothetical protein SJAG_03156 [Schizosaccharomyces japonicus yFS275]|uniref:U3 small nucleolar RNA-associated protein 22 n=1 Tax=Schizosaccharomyces japonicus (strain yFS275 / FY16936) TaxID=402676 RepID=B6K3H2_SCHJY|nr:hypothetical protein SJAG_03156 [Schizosaccharomyces japonicus yFS275]EEB08029.1 hypothetical protein SJAG_03156 [Schizosaccharomyces japonicus yFS275]
MGVKDQTGQLSGSKHARNADEEMQDASFSEDVTEVHSDLRTKRPKSGHKAEVLEDLTLSKLSAFDLKVNELLKEVVVSGKRVAKALSFVNSLKKTIRKISEVREAPFWDAKKKLEHDYKLIIPFPQPLPPTDTNIKLSYKPPVSVEVSGLFGQDQACVSPDGWSIDLLIEIPGDLFTDKDYLNLRYFHKRAYYLAKIAGKVTKSLKDSCEISFTFLNDDTRKPILEIVPKDQTGSAKKHYRVRLLPYVNERFRIQKLLPHKNGIRTVESTEDHSLLPTPKYNYSILEDTSLGYYAKCVKEVASSPYFVNACALGNVWLNQHDFSSSVHECGFGFHEWCSLLAILMSSKDISAGFSLSSYLPAVQLFKGTLMFLASKELENSILQTNGSIDTSHFSSKPTFFDGRTGLNLFHKVNPVFFQKLQSAARHTLRLTGAADADAFDSVFLTKVNSPIMLYDVYGYIPVQLSVEEGDVTKDSDSAFTNYLDDIYQLLKRGLGDRIDFLTVFSATQMKWGLKDLWYTALPKEISIGILLNPDVSIRVIDIGPSAENEAEAAAFREFWGELSELRKFKDGTIAECVYWDCPTPEDRRRIPQRIIQKVLSRHIASTVGDCVRFVHDGFSDVLGRTALVNSTDTFHEFVPVLNAYHEAVKTVMTLEDMPLAIADVVPADEALRYSSSRIPGAETYATSPVNVVFNFESSARWPDDLESIQKTKIAFLLKMAEVLNAEENVERAMVGLENNDKPKFNNCFLQVMFTNGFTFNFRLRHDRELTLWDLRLKRRENVQEAKTGKFAYEHDFQFIPRHTLAIQAVCQKYRSCSKAIRLAKHWFYSHLLTDHVSDEIIELLAASVYVNLNSWQVPSSGETAFCRMLYFLSTWDWRFEPLIVDVNENMTADQRNEIRHAMDQHRKNDVSLSHAAFFVAVEYDLESKYLGWLTPSKVIANRITMLAKASFQLLTSTTPDLKLLFQPSLTSYHCIIRLRTSKLPIFREKAKLEYKNLQMLVSNRPGFDPVKSFVEELMRIYSDVAYFFYNKNGPRLIACVFDPRVLEPRPFKISLDYPFVVQKSGNVTLDIDLVMEEIRRLGGDMIKSVERV